MPLIVERSNSASRITDSLEVERQRNFRAAVFDAVAVGAVVLLALLGILNLYASAGQVTAEHQLVAVAAGFVMLAVLGVAPAGWTMALGRVTYVVSVLLLAAVLVVGVGANGAHRWLAVGSFTFQPSELVKLALLFLLADVLGSTTDSAQRTGFALVLAAVPILMVVMQPDLSTATLLAALAVAMLISARSPVRLLFPLLAAALIVAPLGVELLRPYQLARLQGFVNGGQSVSGSGFAVHEAHIALASGGFFGQAGRGHPLHHLMTQYLPAHQTDLAFASMVEQWGLIAGGLALIAVVVLILRVALAARTARTRTSALIAGGFAILLGMETVASLGGNLGVLPLAGIPFPFLSSGGTAAAVHLAVLGTVLQARKEGAKRRLWSMPAWNRRPRLIGVAAVGLTGALLFLGVYGWRLQQVNGASWRLAGAVQIQRCVTLNAPRGLITDRHDAPLAANTGLKDLYAVPFWVRSNPAELTRLAGLLGTTRDQLHHVLSAAPKTNPGVKLAELPGPAADKINQLGLRGVFIAPSARRLYPTGPVLAPLLGFVGITTPADQKRWPGLPHGELVGRSGLEESYDPLLRGVNGQQCIYVDPSGVPVAMGTRREPTPGANLRTSLDLGLQNELTSALSTAMGNSGGDMAGAVVMDPKTGGVLAMASLPSFDNSVYGPPIDGAGLGRSQHAPGNPMLEHVTQVVAPPGSTFKLVVAATDTVYNAFKPEQVVPTGASFTLGDTTFNNWKPLGPSNLMDAIGQSNDVYFYKLALALGPDKIYKIGSELGVGQPSGIDVPGESSGYFGSPATVKRIGAVWYPASTVIMGIGQGYIDVTPLQDARWTAGMATGNLVTPHVGLAFGRTPVPGQSGPGQPPIPYVSLPAPNPTPLSFASLLGPVREGMRRSVNGGTSSILGNLPVQAGSKTGTAQDPAARPGTDDSWMTSVAPLDNPDVVVTSFVRSGGFGAATSGPVIDQTMLYFFAHRADILATPVSGPS